MKKIFLLFPTFILLISCSAQSQEKEGLNCLGYNPDNPFELTPPEWVQGYWEEENGRYHMEISEDKIFSDIFSYFVFDGSIELSFSILQEIIMAPHIYNVVPQNIDLDNWNNTTYFASLEASCGSTDEIYFLLLADERTLSDVFITFDTVPYLETAGITDTDSPEEIRTKLDASIEDWRTGIGTEEYKELQIEIIDTIKAKIKDRNFDYDEFVCNAALATPAGQELQELLSHISVEQDIAYPAYTVTYLYDDIPFFELTFTREGENLVFDYINHCYFDNDWEEPMETISGLSKSEAYQIVYSRTIEFEKQIY